MGVNVAALPPLVRKNVERMEKRRQKMAVAEASDERRRYKRIQKKWREKQRAEEAKISKARGEVYGSGGAGALMPGPRARGEEGDKEEEKKSNGARAAKKKATKRRSQAEIKADAAAKKKKSFYCEHCDFAYTVKYAHVCGDKKGGPVAVVGTVA